MFGYVTPCKMELKIKDYEKFKAYYCGLCKAIKINFGNIPRITVNYDMTFLAILLDSLNTNKSIFSKEHCIAHPFKKRIILKQNNSLNYAAFFNVFLSYYKLLDNVEDDDSFKSKLCSKLLKGYIKKTPLSLNNHENYVKNKLIELYSAEKNFKNNSIDSISHHFADITGFILSSYEKLDDDTTRKNLYYLGYNLGKWIYIIDAWDDLEKDMINNKFNLINNILNKDNLPFDKLKYSVEGRINFTLISCARKCVTYLNSIHLNKNKNLLYNILSLGLMEKMDKVFKRSDNTDENE
ncbi:hypothetical protein CLOACE_19130 [Clostridium acetireducens DSM 10703]|uniref:Uncharacterized protein n=1 Tax=Clostridium acetireducens DSM 10703 TaxID=1121290 RepID=A0A1E8EWV1_9CLOT|nr:DUF5685 family protein [Clostridium acetireducens]OFI05094.1 hypothetical protein CLOACE_19130 [Clostridium acetireducens DSM 10703]